MLRRPSREGRQLGLGVVGWNMTHLLGSYEVAYKATILLLIGGYRQIKSIYTGYLSILLQQSHKLFTTKMAILFSPPGVLAPKSWRQGSSEWYAVLQGQPRPSTDAVKVIPVFPLELSTLTEMPD